MASRESHFAADRLPAPLGRTPEDLAAWVALSSVPGLGSATLWNLIRAFGDLSQAWTASAARLQSRRRLARRRQGQLRPRVARNRPTTPWKNWPNTTAAPSPGTTRLIPRTAARDPRPAAA